MVVRYSIGGHAQRYGQYQRENSEWTDVHLLFCAIVSEFASQKPQAGSIAKMALRWRVLRQDIFELAYSDIASY